MVLSIFQKLKKYLGMSWIVLICTPILSNAQAHDHGMKKTIVSCTTNGIECANAATPFMTNDGKLWVTWTAGGIVSVAKSTNLGKTFDEPIRLAEHGKSLDTGGDARPQIIIDSQGRILIAYAFFKDTNWNAQINTVVSADQGKSFSKPVSIVKDETSQRFPSMINSNHGIFITWIDKRLIAEENKKGKKKLGGSVAYGWLDQKGIITGKEVIANPSTCECCRIGLALTPEQSPAFVYRAIFEQGIRDHAMQIVQANGQVGKVIPIANDQWKTDTCPHHGPTISVSKSGTIHTAWFTQGTNRTGVFYANSRNRGVSFSTPRKLGDDGSNVGRPYLLSLDEHVWLVWKEFDGEKSRVYAEYSANDGQTWSDKKMISETSGYSDHPLLISSQGKVYLSWLTRQNGYQLIEMSR